MEAGTACAASCELQAGGGFYRLAAWCGLTARVDLQGCWLPYSSILAAYPTDFLPAMAANILLPGGADLRTHPSL